MPVNILQIEANMNTQTIRMTEEEYKSLSIDYAFYDTPINKILIASTEKGVCYIGFLDDEETALIQLNNRFPYAIFNNEETEYQIDALSYFYPDKESERIVYLHLYGTDFQIEVWKALLEIPFGDTISYGQIAAKINRPKAFRAVGTAVGKNPVSYIIPCHRVLPSDGTVGNYYWGSELKKRILLLEKSFL